MWVIFSITTIVFAVIGYARKTIFEALIYYIVDKGYTAPTRTEMEQCIDVVVKNKIDKLFKK